METNVESAGGLARRLHVKIPSERVEQVLGARLKQLAGRARIPGFRPGKAPMKVVVQQYGESARRDVIGELVRQTWPEAMAQAQVYPAGVPDFEVVAEKAGEPLAYVASFDVFPEIKLERLDSIAISKPRVEVTEADVDRLIDNLRRSRRTLTTVERPAQAGDVVVVDFDGTIDGEAFPGGKGEKVEIEIGVGQYLPQLEQSLAGHLAGDSFDVDLRFPDDYAREALRGKDARFAVKLLEVKEPKLPEIDGEFLKAHGADEHGGEPGLRAKCRSALEAERDKAIRNRLKREVLEGLLAAHPIEVPASHVRSDIERLREDAFNRMQSQMGGQLPGGKMTPERLQQMLPDEYFRANAEKRVALGLLMGDVIKSREIKADEARVEERLTELAADYEQPEQVKAYYRTQPEMMKSLAAAVLEDQVVENLLTTAQVTEVSMSLEELLKPAAPATA